MISIREELYKYKLIKSIRNNMSITINKSCKKKYYVIYREDPNVGIYSVILTTLSHLRYAEENGLIPVIDMRNFDNEYMYPMTYGGGGTENAWEFYFEQPSLVSLEEAYSSSKMKISSGHFKEGYVPSEGFLNNEKDAEDAEVWKKLYFKYIRYNHSTQSYLDDVWNNIRSKVCEKKIMGCLCRGSDYFYHTKSQKDAFEKIETVIDKVEKEMHVHQCQFVFLATEDEDVLYRFENRFGDNLLYLDDFRVNSDERRLLGQAWKANKIDLRKKGLNYIASVYVLAHCNCFVGTKTSASVFLPIISDLEYQFYFDLNSIEKALEEEKAVKEV